MEGSAGSERAVVLVVVRSVLEGSGEVDVGITEESMLGCVGASTSAMAERLAINNENRGVGKKRKEVSG